MRNKIRIAVPLCGLLAACVIALFCVTGLAASEDQASARKITVETMEVQGVEAPTKNMETVAPVQNVTQKDENPQENGEDSEVFPDQYLSLSPHGAGAHRSGKRRDV